jgi:two-component system, LytTR family, response regulator LytT
MATIRILIIEDEIIIAEDLRRQLVKLGYEVTGIAKSYNKAMQLIEEDLPDFMLIDIKLKGEKDGIDLAETVKNRYDLPLIFLTSHADKNTVERAKRVHPNGYLIKPFEREDLYTSIEIAFTNYLETKAGIKESKNLEEKNSAILDDSIFVKKDHLLIKIRFDELQWITAERNYLELHCNDKMHLIRSTLKEFLDKLPADLFIQVHRSHAVNVKHISAIEYAAVIINKKEIPLSRPFIDPLKERLKIVT